VISGLLVGVVLTLVVMPVMLRLMVGNRHLARAPDVASDEEEPEEEIATKTKEVEA